MTQRTILFRVWDTKFNCYREIFSGKTGAMLHDTGIAISTGYDSEDNPTWDWKLVEFDRYIFEQFTGLLDRNGKQIFEGDIVKCPTATEPEENGFIVVFNKCKWCFLNVNYPDLDIYGSDNWEYFSNYSEVIGNIHQNPELL